MLRRASIRSAQVRPLSGIAQQVTGQAGEEHDGDDERGSEHTIS
jgi:hypothetical protein